MITDLMPRGARAEWLTFREAINATSPFWVEWRSALGYFLVERSGKPCWVGRTSGAGLKVALRRWIDAGMPGECSSWDDIWNSRILFVAYPDNFTSEVSIPGRAI
jgi:hypothetical protein